MAQKRLNDLTMQRLAAPAEGRLELFDTILPSFGVRVGASGKKSWILMTRVHGKLKRVTFGRYPALGVAEAREKARSMLAEIEAGNELPTNSVPLTLPGKGIDVAAAVSEFIARDQKPNNRSWREVERVLNKELAATIGSMPLSQLKRHHLLSVGDRLVENGTPIMANRTLAYVRRFLSWCVERGMIEQSPGADLKLPAKEMSRDRVLADAELLAVWRAAASMGGAYGSIVRLLIATGQRREEVVGVRWRDFELEPPLWTIPKEQTKAGRAQEVPLSSLALAVIAERVPGSPDDLLFPARSVRDPMRGPRTFSGFSKAKLELDNLSGVTGWRIHDLRRTTASGMARLGHPPHVVAAILNHSPGGTQGITAVYNRYLYAEEKRAALEAWGAHVSGLLAG